MYRCWKRRHTSCTSYILIVPFEYWNRLPTLVPDPNRNYYFLPDEYSNDVCPRSHDRYSLDEWRISKSFVRSSVLEELCRFARRFAVAKKFAYQANGIIHPRRNFYVTTSVRRRVVNNARLCQSRTRPTAWRATG